MEPLQQHLRVLKMHPFRNSQNYFIMKSAIKNGIIGSIVLSVLYLVIYYFIDAKLNFNFVYALVSSYTIYLLFMIRAAIEERKKMGGYLGFGEAFIPAMVCFAVVSLLYLIANFAHIKLDPHAMEISEEATIESMEQFSKFLGLSEESFLEQMDQDDQDPEDIHSLSTYLLLWFSSLLFPGLLLGVIAAAIVKKKSPVA